MHPWCRGNMLNNKSTSYINYSNILYDIKLPPKANKNMILSSSKTEYRPLINRVIPSTLLNH